MRHPPTYPIFKGGGTCVENQKSKLQKNETAIFYRKISLRRFPVPFIQGIQMSDSEISFDPTMQANHQMPFIHRRGHLMPHETGHVFGSDNQPLATPPHRPTQNPSYSENMQKPDGKPATSTNHSDPQSVA
jgi:hypothetical protein